MSEKNNIPEIQWEKPRMKPVALQLDEDVLAYFKRGGRGFQRRMNAVLRAYMDAHPDQGNAPA